MGWPWSRVAWRTQPPPQQRRGSEWRLRGKLWSLSHIYWSLSHNLGLFAETSCPMGLSSLALLWLPTLTTPRLHAHAHSTYTSPAQLHMMAKGFSKIPPPAPPQKKTKTDAQVKREQASQAFDKLKATGAPEYVVSVRTVDDDGKISEWMTVGGIAVPRSNSEDTAVSMAIFNNEDELLKGAFRTYPKLKISTDKFEYGYRLKEFPDDPVKLATQDALKESTNPLMQWFNQLDSPLNQG